jgi:geranyl-CoA carboxylase alpha subunit
VSFSHILVANRGEVALRVMRTARAMGYRVSAVYSSADADAPHVHAADSAVCIGPAEPRSSYLNVAAVLAAARTVGADAIHPGWGFLSESAAFASACRDAGLTFIGPDPEVIAQLGNKRAARRLLAPLGVPCVPGYDADDQSDATLLREGARIGAPLMIKAAAGGGGRGMRRLEALDDLPGVLQTARAEALSAFGDGSLLLERAIDGGRHVEVQIFGDRHGNVVHFGERDCSVQRRFQKLVEECPSPAVDAALRERLGATAVQVARQAGYVGAGTVEFLLGADGAFHFLEVNTRLQVEHCVTELCTGVDLVEWQLRVAAGEALPATQDALLPRGHAIEVRLCAEDPARGFAPQTGRVAHWELPTLEGVRIDHAVATGMELASHYDSMLAKVMAHGADRAEALRKLRAALAQTRLFGVVSNAALLDAVLGDAEFVQGRADTRYLEAALPRLTRLDPPPLAVLAAAALLFRLRDAAGVPEELLDFSNTQPLEYPFVLRHGGELHALSLRARPCRRDFELSTPAGTTPVALVADAHGGLALHCDGARQTVAHTFDAGRLWLAVGPQLARTWLIDDATHAPPVAADGVAEGTVRAPSDGLLVAVCVEPGARVERGQDLVVVEAMKLQQRLTAPRAGVVRAVHAVLGGQVSSGQCLVELDELPVTEAA